ncbi:MAG: 16S rRNA processing protein RimM [Deltaproteobacteria bacterium]|nr:16S rRNA processing protein RimM [Deltaproteobacteria bacterium]
MEKEGFLLIGKVVGLHGIRGNLKIYSYLESLSDFESLFDSGSNGKSQIRIKLPNGSEKDHTVNWARPYKRVVLLSLKGVDDCNAAESFVGSELFIAKDRLPELEDGSYYWADIIGLGVFEAHGEYIGCVESIITTGSNDVYVVKDPDKGREILIPALESVVLSIDLKQKTMQVNLPEGL